MIEKTGYKRSEEPANAGSQRLLQAAAQGSRLDKRLWTAMAALTGAKGNSTSLVGTPEQVAEALLAYVDLGFDTLLIRGFQPLQDAISYGHELLPLVRAEVARDVLEPASLSVVDVANLRLHYALTLRHWRARFETAADRVAEMFDETFVRAWRLYLAGSEVGFTTGYLQLFQLTFAVSKQSVIQKVLLPSGALDP